MGVEQDVLVPRGESRLNGFEADTAGLLLNARHLAALNGACVEECGHYSRSVRLTFTSSSYPVPSIKASPRPSTQWSLAGRVLAARRHESVRTA